MQYWLLKIADQTLYPDVHGVAYVYDNTHSVRLQPGDIFIYLDTSSAYSFTGTGRIRKISERPPSPTEAKRTAKVRTVFTAQIEDYLEFVEPLSISGSNKRGRANRAQLGIVDVNLLGWSQSMPRINEELYEAILDLAQSQRVIPKSTASPTNYSVKDKWGKIRVRQAAAQFSEDVLQRHNNLCAVCGTTLAEVLDAAHISPYATDVDNRANPANGICLCTYCHRALDRRLIAISPDGSLLISSKIRDPIALAHFNTVDSVTRSRLIQGIGSEFLLLTVKWFKESSKG